MAKRLNVPGTVRQAARQASKQGIIPKNVRAVRRSAVNVGYQSPQKRISWNYQAGDLVRFRDHMGEIRFGTVLDLEGSMVEILCPTGKVRLPCQTIALIERIEETNNE
jgi:hypothetical protein